ncbi:transporter substrate-binding domain-containing protein [Pelagibius sp.]|uniref:transporter substrate-binding domain-containing protein n=1 Tax=Pelagibius sp. TaxID=1931238 RepID=UPI00261C40C6|nr:transporter substrate-binding domain-containing protein [Pelagibius sp.]
MAADALSELSVPGTLRAGINLANRLLVTGTSPSGDPQGVAPDIAAAIAERLGVGLALVPFATAGAVADAAEQDVWDIGLIAADPKRAETVAFCEAYVEIEASYLVPPNSPLQSIEDVDRPGVRIALVDRAAYDLYLTRTLKRAELHRAPIHAEAFALFVDEKLDAMAGLAPALSEMAQQLPGARVLDGGYTAIRQAVCTKPKNATLQGFVDRFLAEAKASGLVATLIERYGVQGKLKVAP